MHRCRHPDVDMAHQTHHGNEKGVNDFFTRHSLPTDILVLCWDFIRTRYPDIVNVSEAPDQGFCSYTLYLNSHTIVQFRPPAHKLDLEIITLARQTYGELVPRTELIGGIIVQEISKHIIESSHASFPNNNNPHVETPPSPSLLIYSLSRIQGISLANLNNTSPFNPTQHRESLIKSLASFITQGLSSSSTPHPPNKGRIGSSILPRLTKLHLHLPPRFRPAVESILNALPQIDALPWVLTHGDLVPSNIIVTVDNPSRHSTIHGLIDWAEAEHLPFGVGIHSLEEFLGVQVPSETSRSSLIKNLPHPLPITITNGKKYPPPGSRFEYFPEADALRQLFWAELERRIHCDYPAVLAKSASKFLETVRLARLLGIILWHGIAFDDGRLDRVVCEGVDDEEIQRLDVTLLERGGDWFPLN